MWRGMLTCDSVHHCKQEPESRSWRVISVKKFSSFEFDRVRIVSQIEENPRRCPSSCVRHA